MNYDFTIPMRVPTFNQLLRMHFRARAKTLNKIAWLVREQATPPATPIKKCTIVIERESPREPDPDGLPASAKGLLDVLQPCSKRHPLGLGFIVNDNSQCIVSLQVRHVQGKGEFTRVVINEVG